MGSSFREFFVVVAESAGTLIGLLFVAVTVVRGRSKEKSQEIGEFRAAASLLAFTNALVVSLYGLVPGNGVGYPAFIMGVIGILFAAAGIRTTFTQPVHQQRRWHQVLLISGLLVVFGFQIVYGLRLIHSPSARGPLEIVGDVLIASLLIGIGRAWELVGTWNAGMFASIRYLFGRGAPPS
ncbi:MAG: hypothetical protein WA359_07130 [Acidimicrobiales bacterium]